MSDEEQPSSEKMAIVNEGQHQQRTYSDSGHRDDTEKLKDTSEMPMNRSDETFPTDKRAKDGEKEDSSSDSDSVFDSSQSSYSESSNQSVEQPPKIMTQEEAAAEFQRIVAAKKNQNNAFQYGYTQGDNMAIGGKGTVTIEDKRNQIREENKRQKKDDFFVKPSSLDIENSHPISIEEKASPIILQEQIVLPPKAAKKRGNRILCWGKCVTGPSNGQWSPFAVLILISGGTASIGSFAISEIIDEKETLTSLAVLFTFTTLCGLWTIVSMLLVQYSDPGIVTQAQRNPSEEAYRNECLDLDESELVVFETDPIYQQSLYYSFRNCDTCEISRPPKASHCGQCGTCVQGWDHHCVALNNCVGVRNIRAFVTFLLVSFIFAIFVVISCLTVLMVDRTYSQTSIEMRIGTGVGLTIALLTFIITVKPWLKNTPRFITALAGYVLSVVSTMLYCTNAISFVAATACYIGIGYALIIRQMLSEYLELVSLHMTTKEKKARRQSQKEQCLDEQADCKKAQVSRSLKAKRYARFFCAKNIPKSMIQGKKSQSIQSAAQSSKSIHPRKD